MEHSSFFSQFVTCSARSLAGGIPLQCRSDTCAGRGAHAHRRRPPRHRRHHLLELVPRLRGRGNLRRFAVGAEALVDVLSDARLVLAGPSAGRALGWNLPDGSWPVDAYVPEPSLVGVVERYALDALNGAVWFDDRQVAEALIRVHLFSWEPRTEVSV